ncbi:MAG: putative LPS assembly protein LptD [Acidobacteriota bacterium]
MDADRPSARQPLRSLPRWARLALSIAVLAVATLLPRTAFGQGNPFTSCKPQDAARSDASTFEPIEGRPGGLRHILTGSVVISCDGTTLWADQLIYDDDTSDIRATGHVLFRQADLQLVADRAEINGKTKLGAFYNAVGSAQLGGGPREKSMFGTLEPDVLFHGERLEKIGLRTYRLWNGGFTTCVQPTPRWEMTGSNGTITLDKHVLLKNAVLKVKSVPLFYIPAIYYPINKQDRSTGFLIPTYTSSSYTGTNISNAFFWAISRNQDATFYYDWYSKSGPGMAGEYRYIAAPGSSGNGRFQLINGVKNAAGVAPPSSYNIRGDGNYVLPHGLRAVGNIYYFSNLTSQQRFQDLEDFSRRDRSFSAQLTGGAGRYQFSSSASQTDSFSGLTSAVRTGQFPALRVSMGDKAIGRSRIYFGMSGDALRNVRVDNINDPLTDRSLWRVDGGPKISSPISTLPWLSAKASANLELTYWSQSLDATGKQVPAGLSRRLLTMGIDGTGPSISRVFQSPGNGYADRFKHLVEPTFSLTRVTTFDQSSLVVVNDGIDYRVGGDTYLSYGLTSRLLAHRVSKPTPGSTTPGPGSIRDILDFSIRQSYHTNSLASNYDQQYQSSSLTPVSRPNPFTPLLAEIRANPTDRSSGSFSMEFDSKHKALRQLSSQGSVNSAHAIVSANWTKKRFVPDLEGFGEDTQRQSLGASATIKSQDNRVGGAYAFNYDFIEHSWIQQRVVAYYNSQCCGVAFDFQSNSLAFVNQTSNRTFGVSFTLAGIGSFSNPMGSFGGR